MDRSLKPHRPILTVPLHRQSSRYPLPDWDYPLKWIVLSALHAAWERVHNRVARDGGRLEEECEVALTSRLQAALNEIQSEPDHPSGFSGSKFQTVPRGAETPTYDGSRLEKRPDLTFLLIDLEPGIDRALRGLVGECKIVGPDHPVKLYCEDGILRFIRGDYAWAMPSSLMVAYAYKGFTVAQQLVRYLQKRSGTKDDLGVKAHPKLRPDSPTQFPVYESAHHRPWNYPQESCAPGDIAILHLWLPLTN